MDEIHAKRKELEGIIHYKIKGAIIKWYSEGGKNSKYIFLT